MATKKDVEGYLAEIASLIDSKRWVFVRREKNLLALQSAGMTQAAAVGDVASLTFANYVRGPDQDHARPGQDCWCFGVDVVGTEFYVKLVVEEVPSGKRLKVLSFHEAEWPLTYPLMSTPGAGERK